MNNKLIHRIVGLFTLLTLLGGCNLLEPKIDSNYTDQQVYEDKTFLMGVLTEAYAKLPDYYDHYSNNYLDCATDNAVTNDFTSSLRNMAIGGWTAAYNPLNSWQVCYAQIRNINIYLAHAPKILLSNKPLVNQDIQTRSRGEAFFLRAWYGFELLSRFAGVATDNRLLGFPIVTEILEMNQNILKERNTFDECVRYIYNDIDSAMSYLPLKYDNSANVELGSTQTGRASKMAAAALKSRVSLYAASPLYTVEKNETQKQVLWAEAAVCAMEAMKLAGTSLATMNADYFENPSHAEVIWRKYQEDTNTPEKFNFIPQLFGQGRTAPSQQLVDAFPAKSGFPIDYPDPIISGYDAIAPYENRDKRFDLAIVYNGAKFGNTVVESYIGGLDSETNKVKATRTGYYLRKTISDKVVIAPGETNTSAKHFYAQFRKGELWLNYAEAANEAWGPKGDPIGLGKNSEDILKELRKRAGIPASDRYATALAATMDKDQFRELIHNERRVELCFENHRFFDIRRWMYPLSKLNESVKGIVLTKDTDGYNRFTEIETRNYKEYMYYGPIPENEVFTSSGKLLQNKGW